MALPFPLASSQTLAKAPVDQDLMDSIRLNLDYLDAQVTGGSVLFQFNWNGKLRAGRTYRGPVDTAVSFSDFTPGVCRAVLKKSGISGSLRFDLRKVSRPLTPIIGIDHQYEGATQSIARIGSAISTQSINRSQSQILTQSITFAKSQLSIQSIIDLGGGRFRYNFSGISLNSDYAVGRFITFAGCTNAANNGTFAIAEVNQSGFPSIVVSNPSGVAQTAAAGTADLQLMSYNFSNPVSTDYVSGEAALFAGHTAAANDGTLEVYKVNQAGNNIWVYNQTGVTQGGVAGTTDVNRWIFAYSSAVNTAHYVAGELAESAGHTSAANDGLLAIVEVNRSGSNLILYNPTGVVQGGAAGTMSSERWVYALNTDPSSQVTVGDEVSFEGHILGANDGIFEVKIVNDSASNNLVIYNPLGVAQVGALGNPRHTRKLIKFSSDQSSVYTTDSLIEMTGTVSGLYRATPSRDQFEVLEVNRGGGSNFNVVIDGRNAPSQASPAGHVITEAKSIFLVKPSIDVALTGAEPDRILRIQSSNFAPGLITTQTPLLLYILEVPTGDPQDLTVILA
jgi:hypothetical protein